MPGSLRNLLASERLRHAAIAIIVAVLVALTTVLRPADIAVWSLQSIESPQKEPSGEIVFVKVGEAISDIDIAERNLQLIDTIDVLEAAGADRIFLDLPIEKSRSKAVDHELRTALSQRPERVFLAAPVRDDFPENDLVEQTDPFFTQRVSAVANDYQTDFLSYVWGLKPSYLNGEAIKPALWNELAGKGAFEGPIYPDYAFDVSAVPQYSISELSSQIRSGASRFSGKTVVIGPAGLDARQIKVPGYGKLPSSLVHIIAAETALAGSGQFWSEISILISFSALLMLGILLTTSPTHRRVFYTGWAIVLFVAIAATATLGIRGIFSGTLALAAIYASLRFVTNFKRRHLYIETRSKLPNFLALQRDFSDIEQRNPHAVVVAKIARLDAIFATLTPWEQGKYLRQFAARLALGDDRSKIYYDGGKYFAFLLPRADYQDLKSHLEGLRAVASQSLTVSDRTLDVSMTIGADELSDKPVSSRLSAATAAADQAREAYRPVFLIADFDEDGQEWDHSLQSRLETALSEDRISIKLQPQAELQTGRIVGAEALARWVDEQRGNVAPARFILQCERVGRLDQLTKRVLSKSLQAAELLRKTDANSYVSVNVSSIQFVDHRIADLIEECLSASAVKADALKIEVTETARIDSFATARNIFERLNSLGIRISMDDFGVASANLEAMYELPFDEIKIDQMFVKNINNDVRAKAIVSNIVRLVRDAGLVSVAEGIEDRESWDTLRNMGCDLGQGFHIARPMTPAEFDKTLCLQKDTSLLTERFG